MLSKPACVESFRSFYTFYLIDRFGVSIPISQLMLFVFFVFYPAGVLLGGILGQDRH
jgi:FSR family fosmidomycin resistance protein-like MFS transporter